MLSKPMLKVFASSLVTLVRQSDEMNKEVRKFRDQHMSFFRKTFVFDFANYGVRVLFVGPTPNNCNELYEITNRETNEVLLSTLQ